MLGFIPPAATLRAALGVGTTLFLLASYTPLSQAALSLNATRVVFESDKRSVSLIVNNPSQSPYAVQTWVNTASDDTTTAVPFIPSPPLFRLNPGKEQQVQINGLPNNLPTDRESLFYFNVQEIPQAGAVEGNVLNIALRTRIKLFYRPAQLKDKPASRLKDLHWSLEHIGGKPHLVVNNPTPFHVSFSRIELSTNGPLETLNNPAMVEPMKQQRFALSALEPVAGLRVSFTAINDYGAVSAPQHAPVQLTP
ncbi:molecular chaperone [Pseudomonas sp. MWU13-2105]|uniref:fimbrial biogenesis chaperone n=1 Tax=Pseudomonas sp. MWU13-2105 TaxID=2935074 RepID=UPI00200BF5A7|nr:molecular chaperone [Pseudomonas sp. MWU13-2105]